MRKSGISMVALVITIIVLIVLTSAVVITGIGAPKQAQLAVFYNNLDTVQELVTLKMSDNMITGVLSGYGDNYKWVDIVENYTAEKGQANEPIVFDEYQINGVWLERISPTMLKNNTSLAEGERSKYYVSSQGTVYYEGFVYEGQTYYTKNADPVENGQTLTSLLPTNGSFYEAKGVNSPRLLPGMTAVYWDANGNEVTSTNPGADAEFYNNWYDYIAQTSTTENGGTSKWANAKTSDGSYWVWIPRYAYSITSGYHGEGLNYTGSGTSYQTTEAGTIEVEFLKGRATTSSVEDRTFVNASGINNWNIHPAFTVEGIELAGIWVAKFEMSMETNGVNTVTSEQSIGNKLTNASIKAVSKPGVSSWRFISIGKAFTNALAYNSTYQSHLMKNMEWGAVAYLTHSIYGRNGTEVTTITNSEFTGGTSGANAINNVLQSTTGNVYGIYDVAGVYWEWTAAYLQGTQNTNQYGGVLVDADFKYKDVYTSYSDTKFGDAVYETSASSKSIGGSWYRDYSSIMVSDIPFSRRGGRSVGQAGIFAFIDTDGSAMGIASWRVVLWGSLN